MKRQVPGSVSAFVCVSVMIACGSDPAFRNITTAPLDAEAVGATEASAGTEGDTAASQESAQKDGALKTAAASVQIDIPPAPPSTEGDAQVKNTEAIRSGAPGLAFETASVVMRPAETRTFAPVEKNLPPGAELVYTIVKPAGMENADLGSINAQGQYTAPKTVTEGLDKLTIKVGVKGSDDVNAAMDVKLIPNKNFVIEDDNLSQGLAGAVYDFDNQEVTKLPDFSKMTPTAKVLMPNFAVPLRSFLDGFPGVPDLFEWFGVRFTGKLVIANAGLHKFTLQCDDGAKLTINNTLVVDNDGVHGSRRKSGQITLTNGAHDIQVDYFQGPRQHIELQLFWTPPGATAETLVPSTVFRRPTP